MGICEKKLDSNITLLQIYYMHVDILYACMHMNVHTCLYTIHVHIYVCMTAVSIFKIMLAAVLK